MVPLSELPLRFNTIRFVMLSMLGMAPLKVLFSRCRLVREVRRASVGGIGPPR
uniref:Putative inactive leucine-rich repeat receptor-like protein kinase At3g03770 isoform X2 n=2 Tax=Rhizophora mucronata TaxID=61149 RepID=A0A2P2IN27_RHIMU